MPAAADLLEELELELELVDVPVLEPLEVELPELEPVLDAVGEPLVKVPLVPE